MPNATIDFPSSMTLSVIMKFAHDLDYYSAHDRLILKLPESNFCPPFGMLFLASKIKDFKIKCPKLTLIFDGWEDHPYLSHMGFFDMCGFVHGKSVGEATGSLDYIPITEITRASFFEKETDELQELPDLIQRHVDRVSEVIARDQIINRNLFDVLSYSIREIFRNVFEHSEATSLFFSAQYWPGSNKVEFAVTDFGIGIRTGLGENPNFRFKSDKEALEYCLFPGVSGKTHKPRVSEIWFNSGYGLYMTSRLARNGGNFVIASGDSAIHFSKKTKNNFSTSFPGTAIRLNLNVEEIGSVQDRLAEFREDGKKIAATIKGSGNRPPSAMSLLLRRDYQSKSW